MEEVGFVHTPIIVLTYDPVYARLLIMEYWKPVLGWPQYAVSSCGQIKRILPAKGATLNRILQPVIHHKTGYKYVSLGHAGISRSYTVHRLVAKAFFGQPPTAKHECNHRNGNKLDNRIKNLEWVTHAENGMHSYKMGMTKSPPLQRGEKSHLCTITTEIAQSILDAPTSWPSRQYLMQKFGLSRNLIYLIQRRRSWKHLTPSA